MEIIATVKRRNSENFEAGVTRLYNIGIRSFRLNYAKIEGSAQEDEFYRDVERVQNLGKDVKIIIDIPYPSKKIRVSCNGRSALIRKGEQYKLYVSHCSSEMGSESDSFFLMGNISKGAIREGMVIIYDAGEGAFTVTRLVNEQFVYLEALNSFKLHNNKSLSFGYLQKEKYSDVIKKICTKIKPASMAFSFVERKSDLDEAVELKEKYNFEIISKIETKLGIEHLEEIILNSDGIMLGRGDLGINSNICDLFYYEKILTDICKERQVDCHIATGFMNSCINNFVPSRSDIIDLSYAISLSPTSIMLNVDLAMSDGIIYAVNNIRQLSRKYVTQLNYNK